MFGKLHGSIYVVIYRRHICRTYTSYYHWFNADIYSQGMVWNGKEDGMEWSGNFGMDYGKCLNGMEDFKNEMKDNLPYFHTNSVLDFAHGIYRKMYTDSDN